MDISKIDRLIEEMAEKTAKRVEENKYPRDICELTSALAQLIEARALLCETKFHFDGMTGLPK